MEQERLKCKVVILATKNRSKIGFLTQKGKERNDLRLFDRDMPNILDSENQHLHFISDEKIKKNDYCILKRVNGELIVFQNIYDKIGSVIGNEKYIEENCKKIIASTDSALGLPRPNQRFINNYIEKYNQGQIIEEIELELERIYDFPVINGNKSFKGIHIKTRPDNTIIINPVKNTWSREELVKILEDFKEDMLAQVKGTTIASVEQWFNCNLYNY